MERDQSNQTGQTPVSSADLLRDAHKSINQLGTRSDDMIKAARESAHNAPEMPEMPSMATTPRLPEADSYQYPPPAAEPKTKRQSKRQSKRSAPTPPAPRSRRDTRFPAPPRVPGPTAPSPVAVRKTRRIARAVGMFVFFAIAASIFNNFFDDEPSDEQLLAREDTGAEAVSLESILEVDADLTLASDLETGIKVVASGITINCAGHSISGPGSGVGISIESHNAVTVTNCEVSDFEIGIQLVGATENEISNTLVTGNVAGILLQDGSNANSLINDQSTGNTDVGIVLQWSDRNRIEDVLVTGSLRGLLLTQANSNVLQRNHVEGATEAFAYGIYGNSTNNSLLENTATGSGAGFAIFDGASRNTLVSNVATANDTGFVVTDPGTAGNSFEANSTAANTTIGFVDDTKATDGNGTMNSYNANTCTDASDPTGLCNPPDAEANA